MNTEKIREQFPSLARDATGRTPIYFDSACVTLRPRKVIEKVVEYYEQYPGCHGRTTHHFGRQTTDEVESARKKIRRFIGARRTEEIIFTKNTTEGINLVARGLPLMTGDHILSFAIEHTSNLTPWQICTAEQKLNREFLPADENFLCDLEALKERITPKTKVINIHHVSNLSGVTQPIREITKIAHEHDALVVVDGAQAAGHRNIDVKKMDADIYAFSGHKMLGPSGTGVLYGRKDILESLPQFISGGETVLDTTLTTHRLASLPDRFEGGLQDYAGIIGLGAAVDFLKRIDEESLLLHERRLNRQISEGILDMGAGEIIGPDESEKRGSIVNFVPDRHDPFDVARILEGASGIMLRAGKHCVHSWYNETGTGDSLRASFHCYNTLEEADIFVETLSKLLGKKKVSRAA